MSGSPEPRTARRWRRLLPAVGYAAVAAVPVTALALLARERIDAVISLDNAAIVAATDITRANPGLRTLLLVWEEALQPRWVYLVGTGVAAWVWRRHGLKSRAIWGFVTMMVAWNLALDLKYVVQRARPVVEQAVSHAPGYSFPSGHAANSAASATVVALMVWPLLRSRRARVATVLVASTVVALTALDRVFLGVHFPSDVVAGVLVGAGIAFASYAGYRGWSPSRPDELPHTPEELDTEADAVDGATAFDPAERAHHPHAYRSSKES